eukprot:gb/GECH01003641.1/.p1 GENE.gb/GECH01003641.1/~~gb/GECH01003641.1/.p1  ORF type:complete len:922 (+),score=233.67 gb/GECH01003641.1/:1-2766(+)
MADNSKLKGNGTLGIIRETKNKWEGRVALTPEHVRQLIASGIKVIVQPSNTRCFTDIQYEKAGAVVQEDLSEAPVIIGVKEVPIKKLESNKTFMFFSHTIKAQPYNMPMLDHILENNIRLIDYEKITDNDGKRLVKFGPFAGYAGAVDTISAAGNKLMALGFKTPFLHIALSRYYPSLTSAHTALREVGQEIKETGLPKELCPFTIVVTGTGAVSQGAQSMLKFLPCKYVKAEELRELWNNDSVDQHSVYVCIAEAKDMVEHKEGKPFDKKHYYEHPEEYQGVFHEHVFPYTRILINGMYWESKFPRLITTHQARELNKEGRCPCAAVGDITCDPKGSIQFFIQSTEIDDPIYVYDLETGNISFNVNDPGIAIQGVDHLPAEFSTQASEFFGDSLFPFIKDIALSDGSLNYEDQKDLPPEIHRAVIVNHQKLTPPFKYIEELRKKNKANTNKILLLGAGLVSSEVVSYLHKYKRNHITVGSVIMEEALTACEEFDRTAPVEISVTDDKEKLASLVSQHDVVISLVPPTLHHHVAESCIEQKTPLITASYISDQMRDLDSEAQEAGVTILNELGLDPGISHMAAMRLINRIKERKGKILSFQAFTGALPAPQYSNNPLGYKFSWSPIGALQSSQKPCKFIYDGDVVSLPERTKHLSPHVLDIFRGFNFEMIPNRDSTHYKEQYGLGEHVHTVLRGSIRFRGFSDMIVCLTALDLLSGEQVEFDASNMSWREFMKKLVNHKEPKGISAALRSHIVERLTKEYQKLSEIKNKFIQNHSQEQIEEQAYIGVKGMKQLGMLSDSVKIDSSKKSYLEITCSLLEKKLKFEEGETDMNVIHTTLTAEFEGKKEKHHSTLFSFGTKECSATAFTVGIPVAVATELVLDGSINKKGVNGPLDKDIYEPIMDRLETEGIHIQDNVESLEDI